MKWVKQVFVGAALVCTGVPAAAQSSGYNGEAFIAAIRDGDNEKALNLITNNPTIINERGGDGNTALLTAIEKRDADWTGELLRRRADPDLAGRDGETPLIAAARISFNDAAEWLIALGANVEKANKIGETPLIIAVQQRDLPLVRLLLNHGADPDKTDSAQGYSARDYAKRDTRSPELLRVIEAKKPTP